MGTGFFKCKICLKKYFFLKNYQTRRIDFLQL